MKKLITLTMGMALIIALGAVPALATPINPCGGGGSCAEDNLQTILDDITDGGPSSIDVDTNQVPDALDSYWSMGGGDFVLTMVMEIAGNSGTNTFGLYDADGSYDLFSGPENPGATVTLTISGGTIYDGIIDTLINPNNFGYYMGASADTPVFYSDSSKNAGGHDQMVAFQGNDLDQLKIGLNPVETWDSDEYILAWEDITLPDSDWDYNDMVVMVKSSRPVPEPSTLLLLGAGMVGFAIVRRRIKG